MASEEPVGRAISPLPCWGNDLIGSLTANYVARLGASPPPFQGQHYAYPVQDAECYPSAAIRDLAHGTEKELARFQPGTGKGKPIHSR